MPFNFGFDIHTVYVYTIYENEEINDIAMGLDLFVMGEMYV